MSRKRRQVQINMVPATNKHSEQVSRLARATDVLLRIAKRVDNQKPCDECVEPPTLGETLQDATSRITRPHKENNRETN